MILESSVDHFDVLGRNMITDGNCVYSHFRQIVRTLQDRLRGYDGTLLRCNCLKGNDHSAQLRLALHHHSRALYPAQLRIPGLGL